MNTLLRLFYRLLALDAAFNRAITANPGLRAHYSEREQYWLGELLKLEINTWQR